VAWKHRTTCKCAFGNSTPCSVFTTYCFRFPTAACGTLSIPYERKRNLHFTTSVRDGYRLGWLD
jgi:hypothetical protein